MNYDNDDETGLFIALAIICAALVGFIGSSIIIEHSIGNENEFKLFYKNTTKIDKIENYGGYHLGINQDGWINLFFEHDAIEVRYTNLNTGENISDYYFFDGAKSFEYPEGKLVLEGVLKSNSIFLDYEVYWKVEEVDE